MAEAVDSPFTRMTLGDCLDDLTVRFLLNLPPGELSSIPRLCFQVEEAQWFYEDFIRPLNPALPSLNLRDFLLTLFGHCPLLSGFDATQHVAAYEEFLQYKTRVPVRGAILMNDSMDKVLLVRGWKKGSRWSFPRGKINKDEPDLDCAIREVYEETGFDIQAAGLVESNQQRGQVKSIDVIMREQHMKLFVFRGVALDTYFEPKTRKEISKIQWYNVKNLPGFKKQKGGVAGQGQGEAATTKFYMVAPFLGHLKKWIGQQRRNDSTVSQHGRSLSAANNGFSTGITEDEGDTEADNGVDQTTGHVDHSADELKRMLAMGGPALSIPPALPSQNENGNQANSLLAMLKASQPGGNASSIPHTPFEQIDPAFPPTQPETPHSRHPRDPSVGFHDTVPSFPYSTQHLQHHIQQAPRNFSVPTQGMDRPTSGHFQHAQQPSLGALPPHMQQQAMHSQHRQHSLPNFPPNQAMGPHFNHSTQPQGHAFGAQSGRPLSQGPMQPAFSNMPQFAGPALPLASPMHPLGDSSNPQGFPFDQMLHASQKPLGSDRSLPEPSKLPPPKLNAHSAKLLDAFKTTSAKPMATNTRIGISNGQRAGSQQQAALLDLFKKSPAPETPAVPVLASPTLTDSTEKPVPPQAAGRRPTLNEITRTLPPKPMVKSPASPASSTHTVRPQHPKEIMQPVQPNLPSQPKTHVRTQPSQPMQPSIPHDAMAERPKSRGQLFDPANPQKFVRASSHSRPQEKTESKPPVAILQKPKSRQTSPAPKGTHQAKPKQSAKENGHAAPQISILQRPGSALSKAPRSPAPQSPLRHESAKPTFQPHVLKRPSVGDENTTTPKLADAASPQGDDKKSHLLSLFGKSSGLASGQAAPAAPASPVPPNPARGDEQKNTLLGLFNGSTSSPAPTKTPDPPNAPQLLPERKPSSQGQQPSSQQASQQVLLNLFNKPSSGGTDSPGTPISPFTLGTPAVKEPPMKLPLTTQVPEPRSRLRSLALDSNGTGSGQQTPTSATPTEQTKGFLLDYLNGVVQKEGYRGTKR